MSYLNNRFWHLTPKNGLVANLAALATNLFPFELVYTTDEQQLYITDSLALPHPVGGPRIELPTTLANITGTVPAGYCIDDVFLRETAGNAVTGGLKIGTSSGGTQIATTLAVAANSFTRTLPGSLTTSGPFSASAAQTIFIQAVSSWNSASVNIIIPLKKAT